ncbi:MAG: hypothetical protein WBN24_14380, partial [Acidimicrobiia bacterium]
DKECEADQDRAQARDRDQIRLNDGEAAQTRTQAREEVQVREHDGECLGTDKGCEADQDRAQARDRDQIRANDGVCFRADSECDPLREMTRAEAEERIVEHLAALAAGSVDGEYLRVLTRWMLAHMYGPFSALFT